MPSGAHPQPHLAGLDARLGRTPCAQGKMLLRAVSVLRSGTLASIPDRGTPLQPTSLLALAATLLLPACTNYDFAKARRPDGSWDHQRLVADLQASGEEKLTAGTWIPLLYMDLTIFKPSDPCYPRGFTIEQFGAVGPVFLAGSMQREVVTGDGVTVETGRDRWLGWGLLYRGQDQAVPTPHGERRQDSDRCLLLFGGDDDVVYVPAKQP